MKDFNFLNKLFKIMTLFLVSYTVYAQGTLDDYQRAEQFLPWNASKLVYQLEVKPNWIDKSDQFWYRNYTPNGKQFIVIDPIQNTRNYAFDHTKLASSLSRAKGISYQHNNLPFDDFKFIKQGQAIQFTIDKTCWTCNLATYQCTRISGPSEATGAELLSPDNRFSAFVKDYNLYVREAATKKEIQLTSDGIHHYGYASQPERFQKIKLPLALVWSPDSKKLITHRLDERMVDNLYLIQSVLPKGKARPVLHSYSYPLPGDKNVPLAELFIFDVEERRKIIVDSEPLIILHVSPMIVKKVWWGKDSTSVYFLKEERGFKKIRLCRVDAVTGAVQTILEENGSTFVETNLMINAQPNVRVLNGGSEIIWFSERDGWGHLYLYDGLTGLQKKQITAGPWVVRDIVHVDEINRWVYFTGSGREENRDPYYRHFYRVRLDNLSIELLTPEDADHTISSSPTGNYFVDTYSRVDMPPISVLRSSEGKLICELEKADIEQLLAKGWKFPERFKVKARDGITDIYGVIFRPSNFDANRKYPVIDIIYPGPQMIRTPKTFSLDPLDHAPAIAELGFIVVTLDGMGTPFRSKAFHDVCYGNLEDAGGLIDHVVGIKQLATRYPYMDLDRVGIFGHSGGGFAAARAVLTFPDFFKVAVSSAGNHDQRSYTAFWGEKYQGLLEDNRYQNQANAIIAKNLKGKLLLVYGDMDNNVHPAMTIQLIDALIKENKDFEILILANHDHSFRNDPYFIRKRWDYFVRHLLCVKPPREYRISK